MLKKLTPNICFSFFSQIHSNEYNKIRNHVIKLKILSIDDALSEVNNVIYEFNSYF